MLYRSTIILFLLLAAASIVVHAQTADEEVEIITSLPPQRSPTVQVIVESTEIILGPSPVTTRVPTATSGAPTATRSPGSAANLDLNAYGKCNVPEITTCYGNMLMDVGRINGCLYQSFSMSDSDPVPKCACPAVQTFFNCAQKKGDCPALLEDIKKEASACNIKSSGSLPTCAKASAGILAVSMMMGMVLNA